MSDSTANIPQIESSQASKEVTANANFAAASPSIIFGRNQVTSTALTWGYIGGRWGGTSVANGTLSLTGSTTNYVVADRATGAVTVSTATTNWNGATTYGRLYSIVTGSSSVTSYQDHRAGPNGIFVGSASGVGSGTVTNTGGNLTSNAVVLGAGTADTKVVAGITTDGTSALNLGVAGTSVGKLVLANATSGSITLQPTIGALGTVTLTAPATTGTLALTSQVTGTNSGTNTGDQNLFSTIAVSGQSDVVADTTSDTLTLVAGTNITITTNAGSDSVTITAAGGGSGDALVANPLSQFAATTSSQLAGVISDETGSGALVFATSPTLVTPTIGVATATSVNKVALTAPATSSTLTIADGKTLTANNSITFAGTDSTTMTFPAASASVGYINVPQNSQSTAYTTVLADQGKHLLHPSADTTARTFTIDSNANVAYPIGTAITFVNQVSAGTLTISITSDTMRLAGAGTTGSRTLAANGIATALKITSTEWIISGTNLT